MVNMATRGLQSKSAKTKSESDATAYDIKIPTDEVISAVKMSKSTSAVTGTIQAEKPKLVFAANGTLVLQKPKLKVVASGSAHSATEKTKPRLSHSLNLETERAKSRTVTGADTDDNKSKVSSDKDYERPRLRRTLSGTAITRGPGLKEVESYMSKQNSSEKNEKSEKPSGIRTRAKSRSLKLRQNSKEQEVEVEQTRTPETAGSAKITGRVRSETPGPELTNRSRKREKGILKPARSKSSDSAFNDKSDAFDSNPLPKEQEQGGNYVTSFGTKHGQREDSPDTSHLDYLRKSRPKSRMESTDTADDRDESPSDYESAARQIRRVHKELKGKEAKSFQELKSYNMTSKEERDEIDRIQEQIAKKLAEEKLMKELQNCSYLRRGPVEELSVEDVFAKD